MPHRYPENRENRKKRWEKRAERRRRRRRGSEKIQSGRKCGRSGPSARRCRRRRRRERRLMIRREKGRRKRIRESRNKERVWRYRLGHVCQGTQKSVNKRRSKSDRTRVEKVMGKKKHLHFLQTRSHPHPLNHREGTRKEPRFPST